jgi:hypothetical protein
MIASHFAERAYKQTRLILAILVLGPSLLAQPLPREQWGAPAVTVSHTGGRWTIAGRKTRVTLDEANLALEVTVGLAHWRMLASGPKDMLIKSAGQDFYLRLADAKEIEIVPYDTGFKTGMKIALSQWARPAASSGTNAPAGGAGAKSDLALFLTICLEGQNEELVFDAVAVERTDRLRQLDWPTALDAGDVDYTILSNGRGNLLPRDWPKEYFPIRTITKEGKVSTKDHSVLQSHVIESWSMSWWGFQKGKSAAMLIVETPDDAAYQFFHPAGGPTVVGPRWLATLGRFGYSRSARMCFFDDADYVTLAKRYRRYVMDTGLFVSLKEKIARTPGLADLLGTPQTRVRILKNLAPDSDRYDHADPATNYSMTTFDDRARQLRELKARGIERALVFITAWPHLGYDRQHPDPLPPPEVAGGWEGLKRLADTCRELGYPFIFHDQYRDYYADAPSYDPQFAIHEEDAASQPKAFAGTRFGDWKEGEIPFMRHWDGGKQTYLNARFQAGHLRKNYQLFFAHDIHPQGIYIDVVGYVPPDEDFNPEHPTTRTEAMRGQIACLNWARQNLGCIATEAGSDWVIPYVDVINQSGGTGKCIPVPLYQLVYHDAVLISYGGRNDDLKNLLQGVLCGGVPELPLTADETDGKRVSLIRQMAALHRRVALLEMIRHEFLDTERRKERTTFSDGTTVTVDWDANTASVSPSIGQPAKTRP